jgi:hypothetical protein
VTNDGETVAAQRVSEARNVGRQDIEVISGDPLRLVALAVAALVGCDNTEARLRQRRDVMAPAVPIFGKAVQQEDKRAVRRPQFRAIERDAVRLAADKLDIHANNPRCTIRYLIARCAPLNRRKFAVTIRDRRA